MGVIKGAVFSPGSGLAGLEREILRWRIKSQRLRAFRSWDKLRVKTYF